MPTFSRQGYIEDNGVPKQAHDRAALIEAVKALKDGRGTCEVVPCSDDAMRAAQAHVNAKNAAVQEAARGAARSANQSAPTGKIETHGYWDNAPMPKDSDAC